MRDDTLLVVNEAEVETFSIAREGSDGYVLAKRLIDPETSGSQRAIVLVVETPPGQTALIPPHLHRGYEETMYVLSGRGTYRAGRTPDELQSLPIALGSCLYMPADYYHQLQTEGAEPLKLVVSYFCIYVGARQVAPRDRSGANEPPLPRCLWLAVGRLGAVLAIV